MSKKLMMFASLAAVLCACSSKPIVNGQKFEADQTLSTAADKPMPEWAEMGETQPFRVDGGKVYSVGITQIRGDERAEAAARVATNNAYANVAKHVENKTEFILQNSEENFGYDSTSAKFIGSEVSNITSHEFTNEGIWWKRYVQMQEDGSRRIFYKVYSLVTLPEPSLKAAVHKAISGQGERKISQAFQKQVDARWDTFLNGDKAPQENRNPSNTEDQE